MLSRREFFKAAVAAGTAVAVPPALQSFLESARAGTSTAAPESGFFLDKTRWATCQALCARIVPTGSDPATDPGATEARAVVFIDRFLSAFELPSQLADGPAIWVHGRWSGRNPFAGAGGFAGDDYPPDDFLDSGGTGHFLGLTPAQVISWRYQLYGPSALAGLPASAQTWAKQVASALIPSPTPPAGLRQTYEAGLAAFDAYSKSTFGTSFASANSVEQDLMLAVAGNLLLNAVTGNVPIPLPSPPAAPPAASALVPIITLHTFQATYGIPEYSWRNQGNDPTVIPLEGTAQWRAIGYDGDTQPLGNSVFDPDLYGPGEGPNQGFGEEGVYVPFGGYREFRPVSTLDPSGTTAGRTLTAADAATVQQALALTKVKAK